MARAAWRLPQNPAMGAMHQGPPRGWPCCAMPQDTQGSTLRGPTGSIPPGAFWGCPMPVLGGTRGAAAPRLSAGLREPVKVLSSSSGRSEQVWHLEIYPSGIGDQRSCLKLKALFNSPWDQSMQRRGIFSPANHIQAGLSHPEARSPRPDPDPKQPLLAPADALAPSLRLGLLPKHPGTSLPRLISSPHLASHPLLAGPEEVPPPPSPGALASFLPRDPRNPAPYAAPQPLTGQP